VEVMKTILPNNVCATFKGNLAERFSHAFILSHYRLKNLVLVSDTNFRGGCAYRNEGRYFYAVTEKEAKEWKRKELVFKRGRRYISYDCRLRDYIFETRRKCFQKLKKSIIDFKRESKWICADAVVFMLDGSIDFYEIKSGSTKLTTSNKENFERLKCLKQIKIYVLRCNCEIPKSADVRVEIYDN